MKNKKSLGVVLMALLISGCNTTSNSTSSSSSYNQISTTPFTSSSQTTISSSSSSVFEGYVDFDIALGNTRYYALSYGNNDNMYVEINLENMYYTSFSRTSYVVLDSDPEFLHAFSTYRDSEENNYELRMDVHGRSYTRDGLETLEKKDLVHVIAPYVDRFEKTNDYTWEFDSILLCRELSDFFQLKALKYCNLIEFEVGMDNRLSKMKVYEGEGNYKAEILNVNFHNYKLEDLPMYQKWVADGSIINERIIDYKMLYSPEEEMMVSVYNNETVTIDATVVAKDSYGNIYVANEDQYNGNVGIKVIPNKNSDVVEIGDIVTVTGKVATSNFVVSIQNAEVKDSGNDADYPPIFDEEVIVDNNGGGTYAAQIFSTVPYYSDSVYSTYAYVKSMPQELDENKDTVIEVIFPTYQNQDIIYSSEIIIPKELSLSQKTSLFTAFKEAGIYGEENCYELSLERFVMKFDSSYFFAIKLLATEDTDVGKRLNAQEKVAKYVGLDNFPVMEDDGIVSYKFGGASGLFLEQNFGLDTKATQGIYIGYGEIELATVYAYFEALVEYGASLHDIIKDAYSGKHYIYKYNDTIIDISLNAGYESITGMCNMWVYNGELLRCPNIKEKLESEIGSWFNVDDFLVASNTYDYDYNVVKLLDYANNTYTLEDPLYCVTIDTNENIRDTYNRTLVKEMGYSQKMNGNVPYTYTSRGQTHYIFEKNGIILDIACYPTSDYTYTGHDQYEYRLEVLIYKGPNVMSIKTYDNLDFLSDLYAKDDASLAYSPELPSDAVVEIWRDLHDFSIVDVEYGYGCRDEAFIYTAEVESAYEMIKEGMVEAGYKITSERTYSVSFSKKFNGQDYYIFMLKCPDKGYVRFMNGVGGIDFSI